MAGRRCRGRGAALPRGGRGRGWAGGGVAGPVPSHRGAKFKPRAPAERDAAEGPGRTGPGSPGAAVGSAPAGLHGECTGTAAPLPLPRTGAAELRGGRPAVSSPPTTTFPRPPLSSPGGHRTGAPRTAGMGWAPPGWDSQQSGWSWGPLGTRLVRLGRGLDRPGEGPVRSGKGLGLVGMGPVRPGKGLDQSERGWGRVRMGLGSGWEGRGGIWSWEPVGKGLWSGWEGWSRGTGLLWEGWGFGTG